MQNPYKEVVYLKNGSIIKGVILEQIPNQSIKIQTADGSVFVYPMFEVERITKEMIPEGIGGDSSTRSLTGIMRRSGRDLWLDDRELSGNEVRKMVGEVDYRTFCSARRQLGWGRAFTVFFIVSLVFTLLFLIGWATEGIDVDDETTIVPLVSGVIANISLVLMCVLKGAGKGRINWVASQYNNVKNLS